MPTAANEASVKKADDHTISHKTWMRYNAYGKRLQVRASAPWLPLTLTPNPNPNPNHLADVG